MPFGRKTACWVAKIFQTLHNLCAKIEKFLRTRNYSKWQIINCAVALQTTKKKILEHWIYSGNIKKRPLIVAQNKYIKIDNGCKKNPKLYEIKDTFICTFEKEDYGTFI